MSDEKLPHHIRMPWFKLWKDSVLNRCGVALSSEAELVYYKLHALANEDGVVLQSRKMIASVTTWTVRKVNAAIDELIKFGMVERIPEGLQLIGRWHPQDALTNAERQAIFRERHGSHTRADGTPRPRRHLNVA